MFRAGEENLSLATTGTAWTAALTDTVKIMDVVPVDSYEAARILLPKTRELLAEKLGEPFFVGLPCRDSLVAWSSDTEETYRARFAERVRSEYATRDHSISPSVFRVTRDSVSLADPAAPTAAPGIQAP